MMDPMERLKFMSQGKEARDWYRDAAFRSLGAGALFAALSAFGLYLDTSAYVYGSLGVASVLSLGLGAFYGRRALLLTSSPENRKETFTEMYEQMRRDVADENKREREEGD